MTMLTALVLAMAAAGAQTPLACDRNAIPEAERAAYARRAAQLRGAVVERIELRDGYELRVDESRMPLAEAAAWVDLERRCCPFLTLRIEVRGGEAGYALRLTGPAGVKRVLEGALK